MSFQTPECASNKKKNCSAQQKSQCSNHSKNSCDSNNQKPSSNKIIVLGGSAIDF